MLKALGSLFTVLLLLAIAGGVAGYFWFQDAVQRPGPLAEETVFEVNRGETLIAVAARAHSEGLIADDRLLRLHARLTDRETAIKTGEFAIPERVSIATFLELLVAGDVIQYSITVPEGLTTSQIMARVAEDDRLLGSLPDDPPGEGTLLPETYAFTSGTTKSELVSRMAEAQTELIDDLWPNRTPDLPYTTRDDALILASIVQKESAGQDEYGKVASVFINRLERGMRLETDVTVHYGVNGGEPLFNPRGQRRTLYRSELDRDTPYNTYKREGLPPTPIANAGEGAIRAVLNPPRTDFLFFVASGTGGSIFTTNYRDHQRAVADYRAYEREEIAREREG
ncbi:MAG: endolytic transglycosylase MltG [Pseudomonadota bacterium]